VDEEAFARIPGKDPLVPLGTSGSILGIHTDEVAVALPLEELKTSLSGGSVAEGRCTFRGKDVVLDIRKGRGGGGDGGGLT
jgi:hypothetical protein